MLLTRSSRNFLFLMLILLFLFLKLNLSFALNTQWSDQTLIKLEYASEYFIQTIFAFLVYLHIVNLRFTSNLFWHKGEKFPLFFFETWCLLLFGLPPGNNQGKFPVAVYSFIKLFSTLVDRDVYYSLQFLRVQYVWSWCMLCWLTTHSDLLRHYLLL